MNVKGANGGAIFQHASEESSRYRDGDHVGDFRECGNGGVRLEAEDFIGPGVDGVYLARVAKLKEIGYELAGGIAPIGVAGSRASGGTDYGHGLGVKGLGEVGAKGGYGLN